MRFSFHLGITRRFLLFFALTALLPMLIFSGLFFHTVNLKLNERIADLLHTGLLFAQEFYQDDLDRLEQISNQAAVLSISEKYHYFLKTGNYYPLESLLNQYKSGKKLDIVALVDTAGKIVATTKQPKATSPAAYNAMLQSALHGRIVSGTGSFQVSPQERVKLTYLSAVPIFSISHPDKIIGALLTGQYIETGSSFAKVSTIMPELKLRIYAKTPVGYQTAFSNLPDTAASNHFLATALTKNSQKTHAKEKHIFEERVGRESYRSMYSVLKNFNGQPIGYLVVSASQRDEAELNQQNMAYLAAYLALGLVVVMLAGLWFKRSFINPINELSKASQLVAAGNHDIRVSPLPKNATLSATLENFNQMLSQLQENEQLRSTFVSTLTHDLRTPLVAQKRVLEMFGEEFTEGEKPQLALLARQLNKSNNHLLEMVTQLLEMYQYEAGKIHLLWRALSLHQLIADCLLDLEPIAQTKNIQLHNLVPVDFPEIEADEAQLKRVLINLLGNALENLSPQDEITLSASQDSSFIQIQVSDSGPGISADILPHLFERYFTGHRTRQKIGSGLGLYICKMIVEHHGGTITVQSELGQGTTFCLNFPKTPPGTVT